MKTKVLSALLILVFTPSLLLAARVSISDLQQQIDGLQIQLDNIELTPGPEGPPGPQGPAGSTGSQGAPGPVGPMGVGLPLSCDVDDIAVWDGSGWVCVDAGIGVAGALTCDSNQPLTVRVTDQDLSHDEDAYPWTCFSGGSESLTEFRSTFRTQIADVVLSGFAGQSGEQFTILLDGAPDFSARVRNITISPLQVNWTLLDPDIDRFDKVVSAVMVELTAAWGSNSKAGTIEQSDAYIWWQSFKNNQSLPSPLSIGSGSVAYDFGGCYPIRWAPATVKPNESLLLHCSLQGYQGEFREMLTEVINLTLGPRTVPLDEMVIVLSDPSSSSTLQETTYTRLRLKSYQVSPIILNDQGQLQDELTESVRFGVGSLSYQF